MELKAWEEVWQVNFGILFLTRNEAVNLKREEDSTPILSAEKKGSTGLMNVDHKEYIKVRIRRGDIKPSFVLINDSAYKDLIKSGECGTRYVGVSDTAAKIRVVIDDELASA